MGFRGTSLMGLSDRLVRDEPGGFNSGIQAKPVLVVGPRREVGSKSNGGQLGWLWLGRVPGSDWVGRPLAVMGWPGIGRSLIG
jgi:hypothetical protein